MKHFLVISKKENTLTEIMAGSIEEIKKIEIYKYADVIERHSSFKFGTKDLRYYNKDLSLKTLEELIKDKLEPQLKDDECIKDNIRTKLDEIGFYKKNKDKKEYASRFKFTLIDKDENGQEYLREMTMKEKLDDKLITVDEYNAYIIEQRRHAYKSMTDDLVIERMIDFLKENNVDVADIEEAKENIKSDLAKA